MESIAVVYNNGKPLSAHQYESETERLESQAMTLVRATNIHITSLDRFQDLAMNYMEENIFDKTFPPEYLLKDGETKNIAMGLLGEPSNERKVLFGYDYLDHLRKMGYTDKDLESFECHCEHQDTILLEIKKKDCT